MSAEPDIMRQAMRFWTTGVAVVTAAHGGLVHGMTVSSFTSISLTPPQVLISLAQNARTHNIILQARAFGVTILSYEQQEIADRFAGRISDKLDRMAGLETFQLATGVPLLKGGVAHFDCRVTQTIPSGTSTIIIGEVLSAQSREDGAPLLYFNRQYHQLV